MTKMMTTRRGAITGALGLVLLAKTPAVARGLGATRATPAFITDLIGRMTIEEKAGQLTLMAAALGGAAAGALKQRKRVRQGQSLSVRVDCEGRLVSKKEK